MPKVTAKWIEDYKMQLDDSRHQWNGDVPEEKGGADTGPSPFDMLCGAIAACKCFITKKYCETSGLPVEALEVTVDGNFVDPADPATFEMKAEIKIRGDIEDKDLKRLLRAAGACPVKKAVVATSDVETQVTKA
jgi:putative redox protein